MGADGAPGGFGFRLLPGGWACYHPASVPSPEPPMLTVYSDDHRLHAARAELDVGEMKPAVEKPERADIVLAAVRAAGLGPVEAPEAWGTAPLERVHTIPYLAFLRTAFDEWTERYGTTDAMAINWAVRGFRQIIPEAIDGKLGYFGGDAGTPITAGTWAAATASANVALTAAARIETGAPVFALCRPPGHHAARDVFQGYCFLNNVAVAAQSLRDAGAERVAILDVDYHHGNGTQEIFYDRADVLVVSVHADPRSEYPYFLGHIDETGRGAGEDYNVNLPLPWGTDWNGYVPALERAVAEVRGYAPDVLLVSFGADTYRLDPISRFLLDTPDFARMGAAIGALKLPTAVVMEGGYAVEALGRNTVTFLDGLLQTAR
jgi:acetoin utilization deacetylase AcuC-like enzyme